MEDGRLADHLDNARAKSLIRISEDWVIGGRASG